MSRARKTELFARLALLVAGPLLLFAAAELGARVLGLRAGFFFRPSLNGCTRRSALLELEPRPSCAGEVRGTKVRYNSLGLRGPELRDDGSKRILAIGDSCTWGWGAEQDETYPAVLQRLLDERNGRGAYQVINAGVPGYTSYQGLLYLRERGLSLDPSIVIAAYGFNDISPGGDVELRIDANRNLLPFLFVEDFFIEYSRFYRWARWHVAQRSERVNSSDKRVPAEKYERNLTEIVRLSRDSGARVLLLSFVELVENPAYLEALEGVAARLDVPLHFYRGPRIDVVHPTAEGFERLAHEILEWTEAAGWLEDPPAPHSS